MPAWPCRGWARTVEKAQARIGSRHHRRQWLAHLVSDRRRDGVPGHQARLSFATLTKHGTEEPSVQRRDLVQQDDQDDAARQQAGDAHRIPAGAEASRKRIVVWRYLYQVRAQDDHEEQIENRPSPKPEHDERGGAQQGDRRTDDPWPLRNEAVLVQHDARQYRRRRLCTECATAVAADRCPGRRSEDRRADLPLRQTSARALVLRQGIADDE